MEKREGGREKGERRTGRTNGGGGGDDEDHFESKRPRTRDYAHPSASALEAWDEEFVRAPDMPKREVIIDAGYQNISDPVLRASAVATAAGQKGTPRFLPDKAPTTLEELYALPTDLMFEGSFMEARRYAESQNLRLMVFIQHEDLFASHQFVRDIVKDPEVLATLRESFVVWYSRFSLDDSQCSLFIQLYPFF